MSAAEEQRGRRVLYLSYDGMTDPLGQSQVLPYLTRLAELGHRITLVSFEKPHRRNEETSVRTICRNAGIEWHPQRYTKRPPVLSTIRDLHRMHWLAERLHRRQPFDLVHCRSYIAALTGLRLKRRAGTPFLFDMRGFWADERVDGGLWDLRNPLYRAVYTYFRKREREFLRESDAIVSLTHAASAILARDGLNISVDVVPCCADLELFRSITSEARAAARQRLGIARDARVAAYLGSIGTWYMLGEMLDAFAVQRRRSPQAHMLWVTPDDPDTILAAARQRGILPESLTIRSAARAEVPQYMAAADYGLFFIRPAFSKQASSPVKLGEMMALGLPVLTNARVGDVDRILQESGAGVAISQFDDAAYSEGLDRLEALRSDDQRWRTSTERWFDLGGGVSRYDAIYRRISPDSPDRPRPDTR